MDSKTIKCMLEAYRRWLMASEMNRYKPLGEQWLGVGSKTEYKRAIERGLMTWVHGQPMQGQYSWLKLTVAGEQFIRKLASKGIGRDDFIGFDFQSWSKLGDWSEL